MDTNRSTTERRPDAVVWIDDRRALVTQRDPAGGISTVEIRRLGHPEPRYLGLVVHELSAHENVMILGTEGLRLALERRLVAVTHRPDRLVGAGATASTQGYRIATELARLAA